MMAQTPVNERARVGTYVQFIAAPANPKTAVFGVYTHESDPTAEETLAEYLGTVSWFGRWRAYAFFPADSTVFEPKCLGEIAQFIRDLMEERKRP